MLFPAKRRAYFCQNIAIELGGVSQYFPEVLGPTIKKFNLARNFHSRARLLIPLENFNLDVSTSPQKKGRGGWLARKLHSRSKFSVLLEISNFFDLWALWESIEVRGRFDSPESRGTLRSAFSSTLRGALRESQGSHLRDLVVSFAGQSALAVTSAKAQRPT